MSKSLVPNKGCQVMVGEKAGTVQKVNASGDIPVVQVHFRDGSKSVVPVDQLASGFVESMEVEHTAVHLGSPSMGHGVVRKVRHFAGHDQVMVEFYEQPYTRWVPFQTLRWTKGAWASLLHGYFGKDDDTEKFRLRTLAHAIENWQENTGSLGRLDIDPLPHQVHLVHHILNSGNLNWLIADDVGLGKTIEVGMLIRALKHRGLANRVLLVTPAGLTRQWQEEMRYKFELDAFRVFGDQFKIDEAREWKMYDHVIASVDKLKDEKNLALLMQEGYWDLVIFDEAHRLSRRQYGLKHESSERYRLAQSLRQRAKAMILLTATPHQGQQDKFVALLELLRPDRSEEFQLLSLNPQLLNDMVYRNNKSDVTDKDGNYIFKGKTVKTIQFEASDEMIAFDKSLQHYLREGYAAGAKAGFKGNAIGFVMTVYRKLASSSVNAIFTALQRRKGRLLLSSQDTNDQLTALDDRYGGEQDELFDPEAKEFFEGELELLTNLIIKCEALFDKDYKIQGFIDGLINQVIQSNATEKDLIFSEYRSTQDYLKRTLAKKFGALKVDLINGSMNQLARREAIRRFESGGQFLISTEAGGEGINLQNHCHIVVNFDLPWNPMRLVQRVGRLYRYGQKRHVFVFNVLSRYSIDDNILNQMYTKLNQVAVDLATISSEFNERLHEDVLGELSELMDVSDILEQALLMDATRTAESIDEALQRAREAYGMQNEMFQYVQGYSADRLNEKLIIENKHISSFVNGMLSLMLIEYETTHKDSIWSIKLSEDQMVSLAVNKAKWRLTLDKALAAQFDDVQLLEVDHFIFKHFLTKAKSAAFSGKAANVASIEAPSSGVLACGFTSWGNSEGARRARQFNLWRCLVDGSVVKNPHGLLDKIASGLVTGIDPPLSDEVRKRVWASIDCEAKKDMEKACGNDLFPENFELSAMAMFDK